MAAQIGHAGPVANRARLARDVLRAVRDAVGSRVAITAKLNMDDGVRGGLVLDDSLEVARLLERDGTVDALELTAGSSLLNPMYLSAVTRAFLREYPYREAYLLGQARQFRRELKLPLILLGGISQRETIDTAIAEGFDFVAMARALLREPDLPSRLLSTPDTRSRCTHCNKCSAISPTIGTRGRASRSCRRLSGA